MSCASPGVGVGVGIGVGLRVRVRVRGRGRGRCSVWARACGYHAAVATAGGGGIDGRGAPG